jgi:hypothetical protein
MPMGAGTVVGEGCSATGIAVDAGKEGGEVGQGWVADSKWWGGTMGRGQSRRMLARPATVLVATQNQGGDST